MANIVENPLWFYLVVVNLYLFFLMGYDKYKATKKQWRIPELNLLVMGIIGGGVGGLLAQKVFHHKTRKRKFTICFAIGVIFDGCLIYFLR